MPIQSPVHKCQHGMPIAAACSGCAAVSARNTVYVRWCPGDKRPWFVAPLLLLSALAAGAQTVTQSPMGSEEVTSRCGGRGTTCVFDDYPQPPPQKLDISSYDGGELTISLPSHMDCEFHGAETMVCHAPGVTSITAKPDENNWTEQWSTSRSFSDDSVPAPEP